ncbi:hypothetical protein HDE_09625 [Halotydeus destructor]|nr:hypothetical protein HDE_09625 [Halotydeus destructor]
MRCYLLYLVLIAFMCDSSYGTVEEPTLNRKLSLIQKYEQLEQKLARFIWPVRTALESHFLPTAKLANVSSACLSGLEILNDDASDNLRWALKALDSTAKISNGWFKSEMADMGAFDQCLSVRGPVETNIGLKYCTLRVHWPLPHDNTLVKAIDLTDTPMQGQWPSIMAKAYEILYSDTFALGTCVPEVCSREELNSILFQLAADLRLPVRPVIQTSCVHNDHQVEVVYGHLAKQVAGTLVTLLAFVTIMSTWIVNMYPRLAPKWSTFFCIKSNTAAIFKPTTDPEADRLSFLNGLRFVYFFLTLGCHWLIAIAHIAHITHSNFISIAVHGSYIERLIFRSTALCVSFSFSIGGFLCYYGWHKVMLKTNGRLIFAQYVMVRVVRTVPVVLVTILIAIAFPASLGSGPVFYEHINNITATCVQNGWRELAMISNTFPVENTCLNHCWYISADFQLYLLGFLVMPVLFKKPTLGVAIVCALTVLFFVYHVIGVNALGMVNMWRFDIADNRKVMTSTPYIHYGSANYLTCYFFGILLGYVIANKMELKKQSLIIAAQLFCSFLWVVTLLMPMLLDSDLSPVLHLLVSPMTRTLLSLAFCVLMYLCWLGRGGPVQLFLSCSFFGKIGRFSFSTFMMHWLLLWYDTATMRYQQDYSYTSMVTALLSITIASHFLGYILYLIIEAPVANFAKSFFVKGKAH